MVPSEREIEGNETHFDVVDRMYVLHAIEDNLSYFFESLVSSHSRDGISLHEDIALRQKFDSLLVQIQIKISRNLVPTSATGKDTKGGESEDVP